LSEVEITTKKLTFELFNTIKTLFERSDALSLSKCRSRVTERSRSTSTIKKALSILTPYEKKRGLLVLILVIGMAFLETTGVISIFPFLAVLGNPEILETNQNLNLIFTKSEIFGINTPEQFLIALGIAMFIVLLITTVYRTLTQYAMTRFIQMRNHSIGARLLEIYLRQPYSFFLNRHSGDMSKSVLSEVGQLISFVLLPIYTLIANILVMISILILLFIVNPWLALFSISIFGGLYSIVYLVIRRYITNLGYIQVAANKEKFIVTNEVIGGIKNIKVLGRERNYLDRFQNFSRITASTQTSHQIVNQIPQNIIEIIVFGTIITVTLWLLFTSGGLNQGSFGQILPILGLYSFAAYRLKPILAIIFHSITNLRYGKAVIENIYKDLHPENNLLPLPNQSPKPLKIYNHIDLNHLYYTYPKAKLPALKNLNLKIPKGTSLGIVGKTGAGKTTLVDVILGILTPTKGNIKVDDTVITEQNIREWQQNLGYVPQEIYLTDCSVSENIALGIPKEQIDSKQVIKCAKMAQIHNFIKHDLPKQYETIVGERGVRLSGGQRQRIGIARALYHNPEVLVFDEATSALDNLTEKNLLNAIETLIHQKTIILIAHRLSTVKKCDQIVLLDNGRIIALDTYNELTKRNLQFMTMAMNSINP